MDGNKRVDDPLIIDRLPPQENEDEHKTTPAWRKNVGIGAAIALGVLTANVSVLVWVNVAYKLKNGSSTVFQGKIIWNAHFYTPSL